MPTVLSVTLAIGSHRLSQQVRILKKKKQIYIMTVILYSSVVVK